MSKELNDENGEDNRINVSSKIGRLQKVLIHSPGEDPSVEFVKPDKAVEWLYEDIAYYDRFKEEHKQFRTILNFFLGESKVLDSQELLHEVLAKDVEKKKLVKEICKLENLTSKDKENLSKLEPEPLAKTLLTGMLYKEVKKKPTKWLFPPVPNFVFTCDAATVVKDHLIVSKPAKRIRHREAIFMEYIFKYSKHFKGNNKKTISYLDDKFKGKKSRPPFEDKGEKTKLTLEGGDFIILDEQNLLIGCGERTSSLAITRLAYELLLKEKVVKNIYRINMPRDRSKMHLDTIMMQISKNDFVVYSPLVLKEREEHTQVEIVQYRLNRDKSKVEAKILLKMKVEEENGAEILIPISLEELIREIYGNDSNINFIQCGGEGPEKTLYQHREQWTDGCNFLALDDGMIIGYYRNRKTRDELRKAGYTIYEDPIEGEKDRLPPVKNLSELLEQIDKEKIELERFKTELKQENKNNKVAFLISANELSRARGGPHCMSMPILRD